VLSWSNFELTSDLLQLQVLYQELERKYLQQSNELQALEALHAELQLKLEKGRETVSAVETLSEASSQVDRLQVMELKIQELEQFTYIASHDLQEPLRKIKNFSEMLMEHSRSQLDSRSLKYMKYILDGTERMQALLQNLLLYSRSMRNAPQQRLSLDMPLRQAIEDLELRIQETQAEIEIQTPLPIVLANPTQMCQLFQNLLSNALKFCVEAPKIFVGCEQKSDQWLLSIRDNGIGFSPEDTQSIFDAFHRLHNKSEYPGTGIGLAICQKIMFQHKGKIWAESAVGKGSTFFFSLPILKEEGSVHVSD